MSCIVERYKKVLAKLFPQGKAWDEVRRDELGLLTGLAAELCRVEGRGADLLEELDPGTSTELLEDWEALLGIPDECTMSLTDIEERRSQARQKLAAQGGMTASFYEAVAERLGFDAVVTDYKAFRVGFSRVGDRLSNPFDPDKDVFRVGRNRVGDQLLVHGWRYTFEVNVEATDVEPFRVGQNRVGEPLVLFENPLLECTIAKLKPAHTSAFFTFRDP
jgi:uncharacterized protein YmfQ (DUF2313 family)